MDGLLVHIMPQLILCHLQGGCDSEPVKTIYDRLCWIGELVRVIGVNFKDDANARILASNFSSRPIKDEYSSFKIKLDPVCR